ncbi:hypothetical protein G5714_018827 [Onychostoma macrolepis]|uniref:Uncharacterized protein n=1 Tax=Onychostoma macrolepis TaxID=369639 RepID=A0A7J6C0P1_9TELE|nr:hypothetical protein G5714_018827 [Onychostoma macrolepis]
MGFLNPFMEYKSMSGNMSQGVGEPTVVTELQSQVVPVRQPADQEEPASQPQSPVSQIPQAASRMQPAASREHFYDPVSHSGFIEMRLRNLRRKLHDDQRCYQRKHSRISDNSGVSITLEMTAEGRMKPSPENRNTIRLGMEKTYNNRRLWIANKSPTVKEIYEQYPQFVDMPYLADLFLRKWEGNIVSKLQKMSTGKDPLVMPTDNESEDSCHRALQILTTLLPPTASGRSKGWAKCSTKPALAHLLDIKPAGTSISSLLDNSLTMVETINPTLSV